MYIMRLEILNRAKKERIRGMLKEQFGIEELPYLLIKTGKERIKAFSGSFSRQEIVDVLKAVRFEGIGLYLAKMSNWGVRLGIDATGLLKSEIKKNIVELDSEQAERWLRGEDLLMEREDNKGFVVIKYKSDFLGCGKLVNGRMRNFVPKERRIKS